VAYNRTDVFIVNSDLHFKMDGSTDLGKLKQIHTLFPVSTIDTQIYAAFVGKIAAARIGVPETDSAYF
jgi:hypothetical protein